jgi:hypothetical protein
LVSPLASKVEAKREQMIQVKVGEGGSGNREHLKITGNCCYIHGGFIIENMQYQ